MTDTGREIISKEDAPRLKATVQAAVKQWRFSGTFADAFAAVEYVNIPPAQQAGEAIFSVADDGTVAVFIFL